MHTSNSNAGRTTGQEILSAIERTVRILQASPEDLARIDEILAGPMPAATPAPGKIEVTKVEPVAASAPTWVGDRDEFLGKVELAAKMKVAPRTIENWQRAGLLPYVKVAHTILFHWPEVVEYVTRNFRVARRGNYRPAPGVNRPSRTSRRGAR